MRTARRRSSSGYWEGRAMTRSSQTIESLPNPERFTADARSVMVVAITTRQFRALGRATGLTEKLEMTGPLMDVDLTTEGGRYAARHAIAAVLEPWFAARTLAEVRAVFHGSGVLWGPYQTFRQLVEEDPRCSTQNPLFSWIDQPGIGTLLAPGSPLVFSGDPTPAAAPAPRLGADTDILHSPVPQPVSG
ncbi:CoA transferase [Streptomyces aureus]|uniref:CoA transferase n=1 Tax=Streptomyces aureus TaxID=193461 RepID=UPI003FD7453E